MPKPVALTDRIIPRWIHLPADTRCCWHFDAATKPIKTARGFIATLYGYQYFYNRNILLIIADENFDLTDPPANIDPPEVEVIPAIVWPKPSKRNQGPNARGPSLWLEPKRPWPTGTVGIVRQGYAHNIRNPPNRPRPRHVRIIYEATIGSIFLTVPTGYYSTTQGLNRFATIWGYTARRLRSHPVARVLTVNRANGSSSTYTVPNPLGGSRTGVKRKRHEEAGPDTGQPLMGVIPGQENQFINTNLGKIITT
jgi:hypothetical protein